MAYLESEEKSSQQLQRVIEPSVLFKENLGARQFILNRPKQLNTLDLEMTYSILLKLQEWEKSDQVEIVFFKGIGRATCAGADVKAAIISINDHRNHAPIIRQLDSEYYMLQFMATMKTPYIAIMDGITMGAGAGMCSPAPFRIATENTQFAMPETSIGLFCDAGASFFLSRLDGHLGAYMGATSRIIKGEDVLFAGLATHFVPSCRIEAMEARLAELEHPTHDSIYATIEEFAVKRDHTPMTYTLHGKDKVTIDNCFKHETIEEVIEALKEDGSNFARKTLKTIMKRSPTGVKVTHEHLRRGSKLSYQECLYMEHLLWQTALFSHDFAEGVRSHIINKQAPKWNPARLEDTHLDNEVRAKYFNPNRERRLNYPTNESYHTHPYLKYALPTEKEILAVKSHSNLRDKDVIDFIENSNNGKFGVRQKVKDVLDRNCAYSSSRL